MSEKIKSFILSKSNQMENTAPVPITNEQALLIDELGVYLDTQRRQRRRLNDSGPLDYSNERYKGYVYQTKHCRLATGGVKIKTSVCAASRKETGLNVGSQIVAEKSCGAKSRKSDLKELGPKQLRSEDLAETETR